MKPTTRIQVVEALTNYLVGTDPSPKVFRKIDGVAGNSSSFEITFYEGKGFYTNFRVMVSEAELFEME